MPNSASTNPLLATKSFDQIHSEHESSQLKRALGPWQLTFLGVGATIGTGIFVLTGLEAAQHAGPAIVISFIIAGLGSLFAGLCYSEFSAMVPLAGSAYTYSYATLGEFAAWFIGWDLLLEYAVAGSTVAVGWSRYFVKFLHQYGLELPAALTSAPLQTVAGSSLSLERTGAFINLPAFVIAFVAAGICYVGISESARVNAFIVLLKVAIIIAVIGFGAFYISGANWHPYIPPNTGEWGNFGWSGILRASGVIFFAYIGFDAVSTASQEARNPHKDVPFGLLMGLAICTVLYVLMAAVLTGMMPYPQLNDAAPVAVALESHPQLRWLAVLVVPAALMGLTSVILVLILGQARILLAMSTDGLLPPFFGAVHPKFRTPHKATLVTGLFAALLGGLFPIGLLSELVSIGTLLAFVMVCIGVLVLRYTKPDIPRPFRVMWPWVTCMAGALFCAGMAGFLPTDTWIRLVIWAVIGIFIYFFYSRHHSKLRQQNAAKTDGAG